VGKQLSVVVGLAVLVSALAPASYAQEPPPRTEVFVQLSGDDAAGHQLAYSVREELRRSAGFVVVPEDQALFRIRLSSLRIEGIPASAVAVVLTMKKMNYVWDRVDFWGNKVDVKERMWQARLPLLSHRPSIQWETSAWKP